MFEPLATVRIPIALIPFIPALDTLSTEAAAAAHAVSRFQPAAPTAHSLSSTRSKPASPSSTRISPQALRISIETKRRFPGQPIRQVLRLIPNGLYTSPALLLRDHVFVVGPSQGPQQVNVNSTVSASATSHPNRRSRCSRHYIV